jgi:hypothetical protein
MTASQLATLLTKVAELTEAAGGKEAGQLRALAARLEPFAPQSLAAFGDFLALAAGHARGDLRAYFDTPKPPPRPRAVKPPQPPKPSAEEQVAAAVRTLTDLYDRGLTDAVTPAVVDAALESVGKLTVPQIKRVTAGCGIHQTFSNKQLALAALRSRILGRRQAHARAEV